jgi:N2-citryl-N6-acetyl-N6-hydroxylysine synthase
MKKNRDFRAESLSINLRAFFNSFVRDYWQDQRVSIKKQELKIQLSRGLFLVLPLEFFCIFGNHQYCGSISFLRKEHEQPISFIKASHLLLKLFFKHKDARPFLSKVHNSIENLRLNLCYNEKQKFALGNYIDSESVLFAGHPFHPYPKCKLGLNENEVISYGAEFGNEFSLLWLEGDEDLLYSSANLSSFDDIKDLWRQELGEVDKSKIYIPIHPIQWSKHRKELHALGIKKLKKGKLKWRTLSSQRTIFNEHTSVRLKFSLSITLTNSVRHLQTNELVRGQQLENVLAEVPIVENLEIEKEPLFMSIIGDQKIPFEHFSVQFRISPIERKSFDRYFLLSTLVENRFKTIKQGRIEKFRWFDCFLNKVIRPIFDLAFNHGVLLGAHLQNIIVKMEDNFPAGVVYRDLQGSGYSLAGYERFKSLGGLNKDNGNVLKNKEVEQVFGYYLVVNTIFGTISALAGQNHSQQLSHLSQFKSFLFHIREKLEEKHFIDYLLYSKTLFQKGNFRCCINQWNENTMKNPWSIYNKITNPINKCLRAENPNESGKQVYRCQTHDRKTMSFHIMDPIADLELFHRWHHQPFVYEFWELNQSKEKLKKYLEKVVAAHQIEPLLIKIDGKPIGYFETYWAFDDRIAPYCSPDQYDRGIHLLIGESKYLRTRYVYEAMLYVSKYLFESCDRTKTIWGEPRADNKKILKFAEKLPGWKKVKEFDFPHKRAHLLECDRDRFFRELENE